jgi:hypothetical protein
MDDYYSCKNCRYYELRNNMPYCKQFKLRVYKHIPMACCRRVDDHKTIRRFSLDRLPIHVSQ